MSAAVSLVLKDHTGANVTFTVDYVDGDEVRWVYKPSGVSMAGWHYVKLNRRPTKNTRTGALVANVRVEIPHINSTTSLVDSTNRANLDIAIPVQAPLDYNGDMAAYVKAIAADTVIQQFLLDGSIPT